MKSTAARYRLRLGTLHNQIYVSQIYVSVVLAAAATVLGIQPAPAADRSVTLMTPKPIRKDLPALPRIADPVDAAERSINLAVQRLDGRIAKVASGCKGLDKKLGDWERSVDVPMHGPGFVSYVIADSAYCGGAHPDFGQTAIVYDLRTGKPVDWTALLPSTLTGTVALQEAMDQSKMVTLSSKRLYDLFLVAYDRARGDDPDCRSAVRETVDGTPPAMTAWLDAKQNGLVLRVELPHAVTACADDVLIPATTLRSEGANPLLLDALSAAQGK